MNRGTRVSSVCLTGHWGPSSAFSVSQKGGTALTVTMTPAPPPGQGRKCVECYYV